MRGGKAGRSGWPTRLVEADARKNNAEFGEFAGTGIDFYAAGVLLDDDVMADGKAEAGAFARWFGREERIEDLVFDFGRDAETVVANPDLDAIAEIPCRRQKRRLMAVAARLSSTRVISCG
jgi:hypothetical protein